MAGQENQENQEKLINHVKLDQEQVISSAEHLQKQFLTQSYLLAYQVATVMYLAINLGRPMLIEGPPGVGKTELAKIFASTYQRQLYRLQCYEGLDEAKALYEWDYQKQLLYMQTVKEQKLEWQNIKGMLYSRDFLLPRPLLQAIVSDHPTVLLIDELDKSDEEFEALLLELLAEYAVTIPELGTIVANSRPVVFITSNGTRELSDPLKRRCVHVYLEYPTPARELEILQLKCPELASSLATSMVGMVQSLRQQNLRKPPSIAETIHWAQALQCGDVQELNRETVSQSLGFLLKNKEDIQRAMDKIDFFIR